MIDLNVTLAGAGAIAWVATRRVMPATARDAHRLWLVVVLSPVLWFVGESAFSPVAYAGLRDGLLPAAVAAPPPGVQRALTVIYAGVAGLLLLRVGGGLLSVRRLLLGSRKIEAADLPIDFGPDFEIRQSPLDVPVTAGLLRSVILLPAGWRHLSSKALEAILRHEAAHVRRRDCATGLLCALIESLFWFNPFVWLAGRQIRVFAEMACDAEASRAMEREVYASELLNLAASWQTARRPMYAITAGAETNVGRRIDLLLDEMEGSRRGRGMLPVVAAGLVVALLLAGTVRIGGVAPRRLDAPPIFGVDHDALHQLRHAH